MQNNSDILYCPDPDCRNKINVNLYDSSIVYECNKCGKHYRVEDLSDYDGYGEWMDWHILVEINQ